MKYFMNPPRFQDGMGDACAQGNTYIAFGPPGAGTSPNDSEDESGEEEEPEHDEELLEDEQPAQGQMRPTSVAAAVSDKTSKPPPGFKGKGRGTWPRSGWSDGWSSGWNENKGGKGWRDTSSSGKG